MSTNSKIVRTGLFLLFILPLLNMLLMLRYCGQSPQGNADIYTIRLLEAIEKDDMHAFHNCMRLGVNINLPLITQSQPNNPPECYYPLTHAVVMNRNAMVYSLLQDGAEVNARYQQQDTALHAACTNNNREIIRMLLERGADANALDEEGNTPLMDSVLSGPDAEVVRMLLKAGANANQADAGGYTPLHIASLLPGEEEAESAALSVIELLLEHGAEANRRTPDGDTALQQCLRDNFTAAAELLRRYGATEAPASESSK